MPACVAISSVGKDERDRPKTPISHAPFQESIQARNDMSGAYRIRIYTLGLGTQPSILRNNRVNTSLLATRRNWMLSSRQFVVRSLA